MGLGHAAPPVVRLLDREIEGADMYNRGIGTACLEIEAESNFMFFGAASFASAAQDRATAASLRT